MNAWICAVCGDPGAEDIYPLCVRHAEPVGISKIDNENDTTERDVMRAYGWKADKIQTEPDEAAVLQRCARMVCDGVSVREIARRLEQEGIVGQNGKPLQATTIGRALANPRICGSRETRGRLYPAGMNPILSIDQYKRVRRIVESHIPATRIHLLAAGLSVCDECGKQLYVSKQSGGTFAYSCSVRSGGCGGVWVSAGLIEEYVTTELLRRVSDLVPTLNPGRLLIMWAGMSAGRRREIVEKLISSVRVVKSSREVRVGLDPERVSIEWLAIPDLEDISRALDLDL